MRRDVDRKDGGREATVEKVPIVARGRKNNRPFFRENVVRVNYASSVEIKLEWEQVENLLLANLTKVRRRKKRGGKGEWGGMGDYRVRVNI